MVLLLWRLRNKTNDNNSVDVIIIYNSYYDYTYYDVYFTRVSTTTSPLPPRQQDNEAAQNRGNNVRLLAHETVATTVVNTRGGNRRKGSGNLNISNSNG